MKKHNKIVRIKPKYIKDTHGKTVQVYLDIKAYESMLARIKEFDSVKKNPKSSN